MTLRNGFSYDCARRETLDADHVRLYFASGDANYVDLSTSAIASIDPLPAPLPDPPAAPSTSATPTPVSSAIPALLAHAGEQHNIDVDLLASIIKAESNFQAHAVSRTGARGLMQLMPGTAHDLGVDDAFRPDQNIAGGTAYLDYLLNRYDSRGDRHGLDLAIAAYNAGPAAVDRYHGIPPYRETRAYVARVEREFARRKAASPANTAASR